MNVCPPKNVWLLSPPSMELLRSMILSFNEHFILALYTFVVWTADHVHHIFVLQVMKLFIVSPVTR